MSNACKIVVSQPDGKRPLERPSSKWEDSIKMAEGSGLEGVNWIHPAQDRERWGALVNTVIYLRVP